MAEIVSYFVYHKIVVGSCMHIFVFSVYISPITFDIRSNGITCISYFFHIYWPLLESLVTKFSANSFTKYFTWSNTRTHAFGAHTRPKKVRLKNRCTWLHGTWSCTWSPIKLTRALTRLIFFKHVFFICLPSLFWPPRFTMLPYSARTARSGQRDRNTHW